MSNKTDKFNQLFKQKSFTQFFGIRGEIDILLELLTDEELEKLVEMNVVFVRTCAPSSKVNLKDLNLNADPILVTVDSNYYKLFTPEEFVAMLLHEIGHVFNPLLQNMEGEYAADGFANYKGYAKHIISGLKKGVERNWMGFEKETCDLRIHKLLDKSKESEN
jgi:hypothetical protein